MIEILDARTANGIAAGEVVERPASVVKELVENSLDAGADRVTVEIEQGGIRFIRVSDNGCGMDPEDAAKSFYRHATSKLRSISDLDTLMSMGFRGEALASIAAVSRAVLQSRREEDREGVLVAVEGGVHQEPRSCGCAAGTAVEIRDLFFNTPARFKFLKRDSTEAAYIEDLLERLAFTRPEVSFRLVRDGKEVFLTPGNNDLKSVIYTLWGKESAEGMLPLEAEADAFRVKGYISNSSHSRRNRARMLFAVNRRVIQSVILRTAVDRAVQGHFVKGTFPELLLFLDLPTQEVDINVHPQKSEVRFRDESEVFRVVYHAIKSTLEAGAGIYPAYHPEPPEAATTERIQDAPPRRETALPETEQQDAGTEKTLGVHRAPPVQIPIAEPGRDYRPLPLAGAGALPLTPEPDHSAEAEGESSVSERARDPELAGQIGRLLQARLIGSLFDTYLLLEEGGELLLLDQHAAHERVLYEKLLREYDRSLQQKQPAQPLLAPAVVELTAAETSAVEEHLDLIKELGFEIEIFSEDSVVLRAVPQALAPQGELPESIFRSLAQQLGSRSFDRRAEIEEAFHSIACKAAVKAHDRLDESEMNALLQSLQELKDPYHCPHGRPVIVRLSRREIEKMFRRIV